MLELLIISFLFSKWLYIHYAECSVLKKSLVFRVFEIPLNATFITLIAMLIDGVKVVVNNVYRGRNKFRVSKGLSGGLCPACDTPCGCRTGDVLLLPLSTSES